MLCPFLHIAPLTLLMWYVWFTDDELAFGLFVLNSSRLGCWGCNRQQKKPAQSKDNSKVMLRCQVLLPQTCTKDLPSIFLPRLSAFAIYETITFYKCLSYSLLFYCTRLLSISVCWPQSPSFNLLSLPPLHSLNECRFHAVYDQFSRGKVPLLLPPKQCKVISKFKFCNPVTKLTALLHCRYPK